jgi:tyrosine-specific transport protein
MAQMGFHHDDSSISRKKKKKRNQSSLLSAVAIDTPSSFSWGDSTRDSDDNDEQPLWSQIQLTLSTALLITGNTVGASCLVLPEMAARPGMTAATALFVGSYLVNLVSGLIIAEVAIKQHDSSGEDPPSSFKEFADVNLDLPMAGTIISFISLFVNTCIMSFDLTRAGQIVSHFSGMDPFIMSLGFAGLVASLGVTQNAKNLSGIASMAVTALFVSFAGLLLPGLANVHDAAAVFATPGTTDFFTGISQAAPIILMTGVFQNIVPSVTKILDYDRTKVVTAMMLGSALPLCMFVAWCFASIGGGIGDAAGPLLTAFSLAAVSGSSIGTIMSVSGEIDSFLESSNIDEKQDEESHRYSVPAVILSVAAPLAAAYMFADGHDGNAALSISGAYGTPLLYGAVPVAMAWTQRRRLQQATSSNLVPGGSATLGGLGVGALAFMCQELVQDVSGALGSVTI